MKPFQLRHAVKELSDCLQDLEDEVEIVSADQDIMGDEKVIIDMTLDNLVFWVNQVKVGLDGLKYVPEPMARYLNRQDKDPLIFDHSL